MAPHSGQIERLREGLYLPVTGRLRVTIGYFGSASKGARAHHKIEGVWMRPLVAKGIAHRKAATGDAKVTAGFRASHISYRALLMK
jgi:hypothetical protein